MSVNVESMPAPSFGGEVLDVIMNGTFNAGISYICAKWSKTNVVAAVIIGGCQGISEATLGKVVRHCLDADSKQAKVILAVGNCLIGTIATIASVIFGVMSVNGGVFFGVFILGTLGWQLFSAIKPEQADALISKLMPRCLLKQEQQEAAAPAEQVDQQEQAESIVEPANIVVEKGFVKIDLNSTDSEAKKTSQKTHLRVMSEKSYKMELLTETSLFDLLK